VGGDKGGGGRNDELVQSAMDLGRVKVEELRRKEEEKRTKADAKRRKRESDAMQAAEAADAAKDQARLKEWQDGELHTRRLAVSEQMLTSPKMIDVDGAAEAVGALHLPVSTSSSSSSSTSADEPPEPERIPLHYLSRCHAVAWETPGVGGVGIRFAPLIGVTPGAAQDSDDEW